MNEEFLILGLSVLYALVIIISYVAVRNCCNLTFKGMNARRMLLVGVGIFMFLAPLWIIRSGEAVEFIQWLCFAGAYVCFSTGVVFSHKIWDVMKKNNLMEWQMGLLMNQKL